MGAVAGFFEVTDRGTATYTIPIELPPGRLGIQPSLALKYLGTRANGMLGVGWGLTGLSTITRCRSTKAQPPFVLRPVMLDDDDRFCIDGEMLVQVNASSGTPYGADGAEYRPERDMTTLRITSHSEGDLRTGYFTAIARDGRKLTFGKRDGQVTASNGVRRVWALSDVEDTAGNHMAVVYYRVKTAGVAQEDGTTSEGQDTGELLLQSIAYGASRADVGDVPGKYHTRFVSFAYDQRPDPAHHYTAGDIGFSNWRIKHIETWAQGSKVKSYRINYQLPLQDVSNRIPSVQQIESITECAEDPADNWEEKCKPPTRFDYLGAVAAYQQTHPLASLDVETTGMGSNLLRPQRIVLDANGDGRDDVIVSYGVPAVDHAMVLSSWIGADPADAQFTVVPHAQMPRGCFTQASVIDLNRDGKDDLISLCDQGGSPYPIFLSQCAGGSCGWLEQQITVNEPDSRISRLGDYNGDGLKDLIVDRGGSIAVHQNDGTSFNPEAIAVIPDGSLDKIFDIDGDGDDDLVTFSPFRVWRTESQTWETLAEFLGPDQGGSGQALGGVHPHSHLLDFNGDGLKDVVSPPIPVWNGERWVTTDLRVGLNTGKGFDFHRVKVFDVEGTYRPEHGGFLWGTSAFVFDIDGDGAEDIVGPDRTVVRLVDRGRALAIPSPSFPGGLAVPADLNGDGSPEVVFQSDDNLIFASQGPGPANLLSRVTDGLGRRDEVEYRGTYLRSHFLQPGQLFPQRTYTPQSCLAGGSLICMRRVAPLVSHWHAGQVDPVTSQLKSEADRVFTYDGAVFVSNHVGWFAFKQREVEVTGLSTTTIEYNADNYRMAGLPVRQETKRFTDGSEFSLPLTRTDVTDYAWQQAHQQSPDPEAIRFPFLRIRTDSSFSGENFFSRSQTFVNVDDFNNVYESFTTVTTPDGIVSQTNVSSPRLNDVHGGKIGLLDHIEIESTRGEETRTRKTDFGYDGRGLATSITRQPDDPTSSTYRRAVIESNEFGVVDSVCIVTSDGLEEQRCTSIDLDELSIYPEATTNVGESLTTEYIFGAEAGELLVKTEPSGVAASTAYDAFGRPAYVNGPTRRGPIGYFGATPQSSNFPQIKVWGSVSVATQFFGEGLHSSTYDAFGRIVKTATTGLNDTPVTSEFLYDEFGRVALEAVPHASNSTSQGVRTYLYDLGGTLESVTEADNVTTTTVELINRWSVNLAHEHWLQDFDAVEARVVTLPRGNRKITVHDGSGKVVRTFDDPASLGGTELSTRFTFGAFEELYRVETPKEQTDLDVDDVGRLETITATATGIRSRVYNGFDQVIEETDGNANTTTFEYDRAGRFLEHLDAGGNTITKREYDNAVGRGLGRSFRSFRRSSPGSTSGTWTEHEYESGSLGRPTKTKYRIGAQLGAPDEGGELFEVSVGYDLSVPWRVERVTYPDNGGSFQVEQDYDTGGNLKAIYPDNSASFYWQLTESDEGLRPEREVFGNDVETVRSYHRIGDGDTSCALDSSLSCIPGTLSRISITHEATTLKDTWITFDRNGNVRKRAQSLGGLGGSYFEHDGHDRITNESIGIPGNTVSVKDYLYDSIGNMESQTGLPQYEYDTETSRLASVGSTNYFYDGNGNQTERVGSLVADSYQRLELNEFELPWHIEQGESGSERDIFFEYDADEKRVVKREDVPGGERITITIGDLYERVTTPSGIEHHYKLLGPDGQVAELIRSGPSDPGEIVYLHGDHLGSPGLLTDADGDSLETRNFAPFGAETAPIDWDATGVTAGFTGHSHDSELGLINMKGRLYDPAIGRFVSADPFVTNPLSSLGWDRYTYVENNPLTFVDPSGFGRDDYPVPGGIQPVDPAAPAPAAPPTQTDADRRSAAAGNDAMQAQKDAQNAAMNGAGPANQPSGTGGPMGQPAISDPGGRPLNPNMPAPVAPWAPGSTGPSHGQPIGAPPAAAAGAAAGGGLLVLGTGAAAAGAAARALPVVLLGVLAYDITQRTFITYVLTNPTTGQVYIGRTSGYGTPEHILSMRYAGHPILRAAGFTLRHVDRSAQGWGAYPAIRGREQQMIDAHGGVGSAAVANAIRGVGKANPAGRAYHAASDAAFGNIAPYTGF